MGGMDGFRFSTQFIGGGRKKRMSVSIASQWEGVVRQQAESLNLYSQFWSEKE